MTSIWGLKHTLGDWQYCEVLAAVMRARKSTFCWGFIVQPVTANTNASAQNVRRVESMVTQGTAKNLQLANIITQTQQACIEAANHKATVGGAIANMMADVNRSCVREQPFSTGENRRLHSLSPARIGDRMVNQCNGDLSSLETIAVDQQK